MDDTKLTRYYFLKQIMVNLHQLATTAFIFMIVCGSHLPEPKDFTIVKAERVVSLNANYPS